MCEKTYSVIVACGEDGGIAKAGRIPWEIRADMAHFRRVTKGDGRNAVVMGRTTWETLPGALPGRVNVVVSTTMRGCPAGGGDGVRFVGSLSDALALLDGMGEAVRDTFVIGGQELYREALSMPRFDRAYVSWVAPGPTGCDRFFPVRLLNRWFAVSEEEGGGCGEVKEGMWTVRFQTYRRRCESSDATI